jgi:hypothetical protein
MPRGDRTGPAGMGPMSGRAAGYCAGYGVPGYANPMFAAGPSGAGPWGAGRRGGGGGRGHRHMFWATGMPGWQREAVGFPGGYPFVPQGPAPYYGPTPEEELAGLRNQLKFMEEGLEQTRERIHELEQEQQPKK